MPKTLDPQTIEFLVHKTAKGGPSTSILLQILRTATLQALEDFFKGKLLGMEKLSKLDRQIATIELEDWYRHPDAKVRIAAITATDTAYPADDEFKFGIFTRALDDQDIEVRGCAALCCLYLKGEAPPKFKEVALEVAENSRIAAASLVRQAGILIKETPRDIYMEIAVKGLNNQLAEVSETAAAVLAALAPRNVSAMSHLAAKLDDANLGDWERNRIEDAICKAFGLDQE